MSVNYNEINDVLADAYIHSDSGCYDKALELYLKLPDLCSADRAASDSERYIDWFVKNVRLFGCGKYRTEAEERELMERGLYVTVDMQECRNIASKFYDIFRSGKIPEADFKMGSVHKYRKYILIQYPKSCNPRDDSTYFQNRSRKITTNGTDCLVLVVDDICKEIGAAAVDYIHK